MIFSKEHHIAEIRKHGMRQKDAEDSSFLPAFRAWYNQLWENYHGYGYIIAEKRKQYFELR